MNFSPVSSPTLQTLYWNDVIIHRACKTILFAIVVAIGFVWVRQPMPNADPTLDFTFEKSVEKWAPPIALGVAAIAALVAVRRYFVVTRILRQGAIVKGLVQDLIVHSWRERSSSSKAVVANNRHAYYAVIAYAVHGVDKTIRLKLPNSGTTFGLVKGRETDLSVLDWAPGKPLIRAVYLGRI